MTQIEIIASLIILALALALFIWGYAGRGKSGYSLSGGKVVNIAKNSITRFFKRIWNSRYRWWWIGICGFLLISYTFGSYKVFYSDEARGIRTATVINSREGQEFVFKLPDGLKHKRIELLNGIEVASTPGTLVGFKFPNGKLYEYSLAGQRTISRTTKKLFGKPLHREENLEFLKYEGHKARKKKAVLFKGSELEWTKPPYVLIAKAKGEMPLILSTTTLKYRVVDQEVLE